MTRSLVALVFLALTSGCSAFGDDIIDPIYPFKSEDKLVVVPFKDEDFRGFCESARGADLALRVTKILEGKAECKVLPIEEVIALFDEKNPRDLSPQEIADKIGADYLVLGDVHLWRTADPGAINLLRGTSSVEVSIFERYKKPKEGPEPKNKKGRLVRTAEISGLYPNEYGMEETGVPTVGHDAQQIDLGLRNVTARRIAELFYGHSKEEARLTQQ